jgi:hypothetical protein
VVLAAADTTTLVEVVQVVTEPVLVFLSLRVQITQSL